MRFLQNRELTEVSVLAYEDILAYHTAYPHKERVNRLLNESSIKLFLSHLADKGRCSHGLGWFLHFLQSDRIVEADTVADITSTIPDPGGKKSLVLSAEEFRNLSDNLLHALKEEHLSRNIITVYGNTFKLHFIFLDMNGFEYNSARAIAWVEAAKWVCISIGLLQMLSINFSKNVWSQYTGWLRTRSSDTPTEETVRAVLEQEYYFNFCNFSKTATFKIITAKQRKKANLYAEIYDDEAV